MRGPLAPLALAVVTLSTAACITGFKHPLGPPSQGFVDAPLLGAWACHGTDDSPPLDLTFANFDDRQYLVQVNDPRDEPASLRAVATRIEDARFLSLRVVAPKPEDDWSVLRYSWSQPNRLALDYVDASAFEDVADDPQAVRDRLASRLADNELVSPLYTCTRKPGPDSRPAGPE